MKKGLRKTLKISGSVVGALVLLAVAASLLVVFHKPLGRSLIRGQLTKLAGPAARFDRLDYSLFPFRITIEGLEIGREDAFQKLGVTVARLEASGELWKLVRGIKPALDAIGIDGLSLRLEQKAVSKEPFDVEVLLVQAADALAWAGRLSLKNSRLTFDFLPRQIDIANLDIVLTPEERGAVVAYSIGGADVGVESRDGTSALATGLSSSGRLGLVSPFIVDAGFALTSPRLRSGGREDSLAAVDLALAGRFERNAGEFSVSRFELAVPGLLALDGTASGNLGRHIFLESEARLLIESLEAAAELLGPRLPAAFRNAGLRGRAGLAGRYTLQQTNQESTDNLSASLSLDGVELDPVVRGRPLRVRADGRIDASGPTRDPSLSIDLRSTLGRIAAAGVAVAGSTVHLVASGTKASAAISRLDARLNGLEIAVTGGKTLAFDHATIAAKGGLDLSRKNLSVASLIANLPGLAPLRISGRYGFGKGGAADLRLESRGLDLPALRGLAAPFIPASFAGWDLGGTADLSLSARRPAGSRAVPGLSATVSLAGLRFNDPSFTVAGENLDPVVRLEALRSASGAISFTGGVAVGQGESLWKAVYIPWTKSPLDLAFGGRYDPRPGALDGLTARVLMPTIGTLDVAGSAGTAPALSFDLQTEANLSLGPLYALFSQAGVSEEGRMQVEGVLGASLRLRKDGGALSAGGRIKLSGVNVERPLTQTFFLGISGDIPVHYESGKAGGPAGTGDPGAPDAPLPEAGFLLVGEFQHPFLTMKTIEISLRSGVNALGFEPLSLELFGGRLELGRTTFRFDPASATFRGLGSLALRDIDIARFPIASPQFKLTGKIQADFPRLDIGPGLIGVSGRGEASVFGGKIVLRDLAVTNPFVPGRSISLNIDLVDLDLKKLTDEVPFGEVTGIVRGEVRDLVITYGQPERFDFRLESEPRKGVAQTFSLKAVDNLTVLSSGQQASGGTSGFWMSLIRGFRYQKLGIVSTLRNDTFTLNGTIREGGVEYLVKKPALFGISVINREPNKVISFKEMTGRLKRVGQPEK
jgi:hypothetical protein